MIAEISTGKISRTEGVHDAGLRLAQSIEAVRPRGRRTARPRKRQAERILARAAAALPEMRSWLLENARVVRSADKQAQEFAGALREFPAAIRGAGEEPRVLLAARVYLDAVGLRFHEETCAAFLAGFQEYGVLDMDEIWALRPALQYEILTRLETAEIGWPELITSLRQIGETAWKDLFESASMVDRVLRGDPVRAYSRMDFESRELYRAAVGELARHCPRTEVEIAETAILLASAAEPPRRNHVGYYLVDKGLDRLKSAVEHRTPLRAIPRDLVLRYPTQFYLIGIELLTLLTVSLLLWGAPTVGAVLTGVILLLLPATQTAVEFMNHLSTRMVRPRALPKLDFTDGVPAECAAMVAVPSLLLNETQVRDLALDLEIRYLANHDPNICFALVTDSPDSDRPFDERDELVSVCRELIEALNRRYPESPFFLFHRHRVYNDSEGRWMGWERKRGKLLDLNQLLRGGFDAFPVKIGRLELLPRIKYVITLDSDTELPRDSAARLIGAMAHPLNAAVIDPVRHIVAEGYGVMQPRMGVSIQSASRSRLAALYSGETGFDIYTRAVSDVYQDLFGEGIFAGKGIYDVDAVREVLESRFPENALLSHDLIEGAYARVALASDVELIEDYPSHFSAHNRRRHRWVRGDWQTLRWLFQQVPDFHGRMIPNPISLISQWKILDNLRRSLFYPSLLCMLLGAWFVLPGLPGYWTAAGAFVLFLPVYCDLLFSVLGQLPAIIHFAWLTPRGRRALAVWARETGRNYANGHAIALFGLIFLLHQALLSMDAIIRSVARVFVTRRRLLEWETAAEAEAARQSKATVDIYLEWTPWIALALGALVAVLRPAAAPAAAPILALWFASRAFSAWLNRPPGAMNRTLPFDDTEWLCSHGRKICRFFHDWSSPVSNWLIPDSVREDGQAVMRLSPTNLGLLLDARIAAVHFGAISLGEFVFYTRQTLQRVAALEKHRGHVLNWYDIVTLEPLEPRFVSTVDSGNLVAALWTLKQAALSFAAEPRAKRGLTRELAAELNEIASAADSLVREMDFRFLYHRRKKMLSIGYDVKTSRLEPSYYDLLASEARIAVFVAIAKGDIPQEAWFHLGRTHALTRGERILLSWTGTMFEYFMPALWMRHYPGTILEQSLRAAVRVQRDYCSRHGVPWGISESACSGGEGCDHGYAPFGVPGVSLKRRHEESLVIAPYSSFLALIANPVAALKNLKQMEDFGWSGRYGFYEAVDYRARGGEVIRTWMAHHEAMSLLAICNLLYDSPIERYFHAEPQVLATERLLHERVPALAAAEAEPDWTPVPRPAQ